MNDTNKTVLTDDEIQDIADGFFDIYGPKPEFARAIESALLSKLRAPVADAQPVAYLHTSNRTLTWPGKLNEVQLASGVWRALYEHPPAPGHKPAPMDVSPGHSSPVAGEAVAWVAADTLNSPHPTCISSLAYMSQLDRERGREYVPLYAAPVAAQTADDARDAADPLQGAADWLVKSLDKPRPAEIAAHLLIGHNRAERLFYAAIAKQRQGDGGAA